MWQMEKLSLTAQDFIKWSCNTLLSDGGSVWLQGATTPRNKFLTIQRGETSKVPRSRALPKNPKKVHQIKANQHLQVLIYKIQAA